MDDLINDIIETTTSGNISYIPGGFTSVAANLRKLAKNKKRWKIQIEEDGKAKKYSIVSEGKTILQVQKKDMSQLQYDLAVESMDHDSSLLESIHEAIIEQTLAEAEEYNQENLIAALTNFPKNPSFSSMMSAVSTFTSLFKGKRINAQYNKSCMLNHITFKQDVVKATAEVEAAYANDLGSIELIIDALNSKSPLNGFDVFNKYNYLLGSGVESDSRYGNLILETYISMSWIPTQKIFVMNSEGAEFEDLSGVFVTTEPYYGKKVTALYPKDKSFNQSDIVAIKEIVDSSEENGRTSNL